MSQLRSSIFHGARPLGGRSLRPWQSVYSSRIQTPTVTSSAIRPRGSDAPLSTGSKVLPAGMALRTRTGTQLHKRVCGNMNLDTSIVLQYQDARELQVLLEHHCMGLCGKCRGYFTIEFEDDTPVLRAEPTADSDGKYLYRKGDSAAAALEQSRGGVLPLGLAFSTRTGRKMHKFECCFMDVRATKLIEYTSAQDLHNQLEIMGKQLCKYCMHHFDWEATQLSRRMRGPSGTIGQAPPLIHMPDVLSLPNPVMDFSSGDRASDSTGAPKAAPTVLASRMAEDASAAMHTQYGAEAASPAHPPTGPDAAFDSVVSADSSMSVSACLAVEAGLVSGPPDSGNGYDVEPASRAEVSEALAHIHAAASSHAGPSVHPWVPCSTMDVLEADVRVMMVALGALVSWLHKQGKQGW